MRLYVANVGVNSTHSRKYRLRSPIYPDETFEFVPIKENSTYAAIEGIPAYCDLRAWNGQTATLSDIVPEGVRMYRVHDDPEFRTFTYGDILSARSENLKHVRPGDQLWFMSRLWGHDAERWMGASDFFFIGFLDVEANHLISAGTASSDLPCDIRTRIRENAHYRRLDLGRCRDAFRVICGDPGSSRRFRRALRVTPSVAGHLFCGEHDSDTDTYSRRGMTLVNRNGTPRRFSLIGSITRTIQHFLDSEIQSERAHIAALGRLATLCS